MSANTIRPEDHLLLLGSRVSTAPTWPTRLRTRIEEGIDWDEVIVAADWHRTAPLLYRTLKAVCPDLIRSASLNQLRAICWRGTQRSLHLTQALLHVLRLFETQGIPVLPFKGPTLAMLAYGNLSLRPFDDLDLLIHRHDFQRAKRLLMAHGYRPSLVLSPAQEADRLRKHHDVRFQSDDGRIVLDLQWKIVERAFSFPLDMGQLWARSQAIPFANTTVLSFAPEDLLLMLVIHGTKHVWQRLVWLCDVAELLRVQSELDWDRLLATVNASGGQRMLYLGLWLAHHLLDAPLPAVIRTQIEADAVVAELGMDVQARLFERIEMSPTLIWERRAFYLRLLERLRDRIRLRLHYYPRQLHTAWIMRRGGWPTSDSR